MGKIKGKFAPLTEELGWDDRFKLELNDFERLMYLLIVLTCHMTHHKAPMDPRYYQLQYGVNARRKQIQHAIEHLKDVFPKLKCNDGKLSLLKSGTYESQNPLEIEEEVKNKNKNIVHSQISFWFEEVWDLYPNKIGKKESLRSYQSSVKSEDDRKACLDALEKYKGHLVENTWKQPQNAKTWFNNWRDWINWQEPERREDEEDRDKRLLAEIKGKK